MISAIVLAAGQATRFGQCKQLIRLGEKALLQHVLDNLAQSKIDEVVVVLGARADEIREQIQFGKARVLLNPDYANGMSTSIQAGLRAINAEAAMIVLAVVALSTAIRLPVVALAGGWERSPRWPEAAWSRRGSGSVEGERSSPRETPRPWSRAGTPSGRRRACSTPSPPTRGRPSRS